MRHWLLPKHILIETVLHIFCRRRVEQELKCGSRVSVIEANCCDIYLKWALPNNTRGRT